MSTRRPPVGIDHLTVVPGNAEERRQSREPDEPELDVNGASTSSGRSRRPSNADATGSLLWDCSERPISDWI